MSVTYPRRSGTGVTSINGQTGDVTVSGLLSPTWSLNPTPPTSGTLVTVSASLSVGRTVFGMFGLASTVGNAASIVFDIETGIGTGSYVTVGGAKLVAGVTSETDVPYSFMVPAGRRFRFVKGGLSGVTETIYNYSFLDF